MKPHKSIVSLLGEAFKETVKVQFQNTAGALAYYLFLSIAPLIGFSVYLADKVLGKERTLENVIPFLKSYFSSQFVELIVFFLKRNKRIESDGLFSLSVLAALVLAYSTKEYFGMVKDTVELTWNKRGDRFGIVEYFKRVIEDLSVAVFALAIIFFFIFFGTLWPHQNYAVPLSFFYHISSFVFELLLYFTLFYFTFLLLPPVKVYWKNALVPACAGALLQTTGRELMKLFTMNYEDAELAESFFVVLLWFYYSSIVLIYSAEFAKVYISQKQNLDYKNLKFDP